MGKIDSLTKKYLRDNARFADLFNFYLYDGEKVIDPQQLKDVDTTEIALPYGSGKKIHPVQKQRDIFKSVCAMTDDRFVYLLLAVESQANVHNAIVVKDGLYDFIQYADQIEKIGKAHRENNDEPTDSSDYLSGFHKTDKLIPVVTLVVYFGTEPWDAPRSLHEMLLVEDETVLKYVPDYRLNLVVPHELTEESFDKFQTELQLVLHCVKCSKEKSQLYKELTGESFRDVSTDTAALIDNLLGLNLHLKKEKGRVNVCKAMEELKTDWFAEGREEGRQEGKEEGGILMLVNLFKKGFLSLAQASSEANMSETDFEALAASKA